jgi:hypothetical protein
LSNVELTALNVIGYTLRSASRSGGKLKSVKPGPKIETGLTIKPIFSDQIKNGPNAENIERAINEALADYKTYFTDPITVDIKFGEIGRPFLAQSRAYADLIPYNTYLDALKKHAASDDQRIAIANLPQDRLPVATYDKDQDNKIRVSYALEHALGIPVNKDDPTPNIVGYINFNPSITKPGTGDENPDSTFDLKIIIEHEIDEVLGLTSYVTNAYPGVWDLFRYGPKPDPQRSFTTSTSAQAFFSIDGGTTLMDQFSQKGSPYDYGDWVTTLSGLRVQDATAEPISVMKFTNFPVLNIELKALNVIGYTLRPKT